MSEFDDNNQSDTLDILELLKWLIRYVVMPLALAVIAGLFALKVTRLANPSPIQQAVVTPVSEAATAVTPNKNQPTAMPTSTTEPTPTEEATAAEATSTPTAKPESNQSLISPGVCGQVPVGWQLYTVQRGNTLYSLARNNGTTIAAIRQANCLYGQLLAYQQIWLPNIYDVKPEATIEVTEEPAITVTPTVTVTVTEPIALPDLINDTRDAPTIQESCSKECVTTVTLAVTNVGSAAAGLFNVQVFLDPAQSVVLNQTVEFLEAGETIVLSLTSPPSGSCYDDAEGCTVLILVDSRNGVVEENEANNQFKITFPG
jgi:LysM repeat protein